MIKIHVGMRMETGKMFKPDKPNSCRRIASRLNQKVAERSKTFFGGVYSEFQQQNLKFVSIHKIMFDVMSCFFIDGNFAGEERQNSCNPSFRASSL